MARTLMVARRVVFGGLAVGGLACPTVALARLPGPKTTLIVPGTSIAGVKIGMNQTQVFHQWGRTSCIPGLCTWQGPGNPSHAERATVSFVKGKVIQVDINAATSGNNLKFTPGQLSKWKTGKNIGLGSTQGRGQASLSGSQGEQFDRRGRLGSVRRSPFHALLVVRRRRHAQSAALHRARLHDRGAMLSRAARPEGCKGHCSHGGEVDDVGARQARSRWRDGFGRSERLRMSPCCQRFTLRCV